MLTIKYRIYPTRKQQDFLWKQSNLLTRLYNQFLERKITAYKEKGINMAVKPVCTVRLCPNDPRGNTRPGTRKCAGCGNVRWMDK